MQRTVHYSEVTIATIKDGNIVTQTVRVMEQDPAKIEKFVKKNYPNWLVQRYDLHTALYYMDDEEFFKYAVRIDG